MKLSRIREVANKYEEVVLAEREATINHDQNPSKETARKLMQARSRLHASKKTLKNYSPIFNVRLGDFANEIESCLINHGAEDVALFTTNVTSTATNEYKTELFLSFKMNDREYSANLGKIIHKEPVDSDKLEDVTVNLFTMGMVKGKNPARLSEIQSVLDYAGWACITNTLKKNIYLAKCEKDEKRQHSL